MDPDRFQGEGHPYPDHWKEFPEPWPDIPPSEETVVHLEAVLAELPEPWRQVVVLRDVEGAFPEEVAEEVGLTPEQQRDVLNQARELLRQALGRALTGEAGP